MKVERINESTVRIPRTGDMNVEGRVFADRNLFQDIASDPCLEQVRNVASLPGIVGASLAMPDIHWGYGFPIGGVAAFDMNTGVVSPGGVGYDINCGVRILRSDLPLDDVRAQMEHIVNTLFASVPSGLGSRRKELTLTDEEMEEVCLTGARWAVKRGYGTDGDLLHTEDSGTLPGADFRAIGPRPTERGRRQMGTLGSGNHFVEVGVVDQVLHPEFAAMMGLDYNTVTISIHTGSRGFGYQVCAESIQQLQRAGARFKIPLPDQQLVCAPLRSKEGKLYLQAMACSANFAFANRQMITHLVRGAMERIFKDSAHNLGLTLVYDVAHNIAKIETHEVDGKPKALCVHRKGATRALPAGHPLVPVDYSKMGTPVLIPGDMGRYSYVAVGGPKALKDSFGSCAHGAGRVMGRKQALRVTQGRRIADELAHQGIVVRAAGESTLREEFSGAYKDVAEVIRVAENAGLAIPVVRLRPLGVVKG